MTNNDGWRSWKYDPPKTEGTAYIISSVSGELLDSDTDDSEAFCWKELTPPTYENLEAVHSAEAERVKRSMDSDLELSCPVCGEPTSVHARDGELWFTCSNCGSKFHIKYEVSL